MKRLALFSALALTGCPPQLTGEPCNPNPSVINADDCPTGQSCQPISDGGGICVVGTSGATSVGTTTGTTTTSGTGTSSGGSTSGSTSGSPGIFGTVTINDGLPIPTGVPTPSVYGYRSATNIDAGSPDEVAVVNSDGTFSFTNPASGGLYLVAQYNFTNSNGSRVAYSASKIPVSTNPTLLDVATYSCTIVAGASYRTPAATRLLLATADLRDVVTGDELTDASNAAITVSSSGDTDLGEQPLLYSGSSPYAYFGLNDWTFDNEGAFLSDAGADTSYNFVISAPGYDAGVTCVATLGSNNPTTLNQGTPVPTIDDGDGGQATVLNVPLWNRTTATTQSVNWEVSGSAVDLELVELSDGGVGSLFSGGVQLVDGGTSAAFPASTIPANICSNVGLKECAATVSFFDANPTGLTGTYYMGLAYPFVFQTD